MPGIRDVWQNANRIIHAARQAINGQLAPLHLTTAEANILLHLHLCGCPLRQEDLVSQLEISKAAISRTVDALTRGGYVSRQTDAQDRRCHRLTLTPKGRAAAPQIEATYDAVYAQATRGITPDAFAQLACLLSQVAANMDGLENSADGKP